MNQLIEKGSKMKNLFSTLSIFVITALLSGCVPTEKSVIKKSANYLEVEVTDNGCAQNLSEASDLAYDDTKQILYIIGDKGNFYQCSVKVIEDMITLDYISSTSITHDFSSIDAEGLTHNPETGELILSTEGANSSIFPLTSEGGINGSYDLPDVLKNATFNSTNTKFEAVTYNDTFGILTAAEQPIDKKALTDQTIYSLYGDSWNFVAEDYDQSSVTALETTDDGNLIVLERAQSNTTDFYITLKKVFINDECKNKNICNNEIIYKALWEAGNFEGITKINDTYLLINDGQGQVDALFKAFKIK